MNLVNIDRQPWAVIDLAEATLLTGQEGREFAVVVVETDKHGAKAQLRDQPGVARVAGVLLCPGAFVRVRLTSVDPSHRTISFALLP